MPDEKTSILIITHPLYNSAEYKKFRLTFRGGEDFRTEYLRKFSKREDDTDFQERRDITYVPAFAKAAIIDIKNSIFNRMTDVRRLDGDATYKDAVTGQGRGVDNTGSSMNAFIGSSVLPELLPIGKVAIAVDKSPETSTTLADDKLNAPYLYTYKAEQIRSWSVNVNGELESILLEASIEVTDDTYGLVSSSEVEYRLFRLGDGYVTYDVFNSLGNAKGESRRLDLPMIPIVIVELTHSLLIDVADYQISHMNLASSDMNYALKGNFPFYTEQYDPLVETRMRTVGQEADGTETDAKTSKGKEITVGTLHGRQYSKGVDRPEFIAPPSEPLEASMKKQDVLKREIRQLVNLAVANMDPGRESAESKKIDSAGLDAGLSYIGLELERAEGKIADIWAAYMGAKPATVKYPEDYSLQSTGERLSRAERINELIPTSPSQTYQKELTKLMTDVMLGNRVSMATLEAIHKEIEDAQIVYVDPDVLHKDVEMAVASADTVSLIRGYKPGEAEKAMEDKARRAALIVAQQTKAGSGGLENAAARGVPELDPDEKSADKEKKQSQNRDNNIDLNNGKRGEA
jgi:hypothetical protein